MPAHIVQNPVPTPEQMAEILGVSHERLAAVRRIMSEPVRRKSAQGFAKLSSAKFRRKRASVQEAAKPGSSRVQRAQKKKH